MKYRNITKTILYSAGVVATGGVIFGVSLFNFALAHDAVTYTKKDSKTIEEEISRDWKDFSFKQKAIIFPGRLPRELAYLIYEKD